MATPESLRHLLKGLRVKIRAKNRPKGLSFEMEIELEMAYLTVIDGI